MRTFRLSVRLQNLNSDPCLDSSSGQKYGLTHIITKLRTVQGRRPQEFGPFLLTEYTGFSTPMVKLGTQVQNTSAKYRLHSLQDVMRAAEESPAIITEQFQGVALAFLARLRTSLF